MASVSQLTEIPTLVIDVAMGIFGGSATKFNPDQDIPSLEGKVVIVTGGNNGIGKETVLRLAKHSPKAIYVCSRNRARGEAAIASIKDTVPSAAVELLELDLSSLKSVAAAANTFKEKNERLDILINNAGILGVPEGKTTDGYEIQLGTNHLGHALLTKLLLPTMEATAKNGSDVRIVNLSSAAHLRAAAPGFDPADMDMKAAGPMGRYSRSKLANVLFAKQLAKKHPSITSVAIHPGVIKTDIFNPVMSSNRILGTLTGMFGFLVFKGVEDGALNSLWAACGPKDKIESGCYYNPVGVKHSGSAYANDEKLAEKLWDWTETELGKHGY